ncbi:multiple epidermal growth factor-like domains protein 10 [Mytilus edulis]|uniref:multiple epidermal growth factor-like domains protein 10 n=1 Tax=Mytilus edulis TaxID=6550 RepID=UPI0039F0826A
MKCDPVYGCVCNTGFTGTKCSNACRSGSYGVNCSKECFCAHNAECNPVTGDCLCTARWFGNHCTQECPLGKFGIHCSEICDCSDDNPCEARTGVCISGNHESECHQGYYDFNLKYNCSETCACNDGATCNKHTGICECEDKTSCINIKKKQIPKDSTSTIYINRPLFIVVVTLSIVIVCVLLLALTYMLFGRYLNHTTNRGSQHNGNETQIVHGHYNESNHYSEIRDDQLHDIRRTNSGIVENDLSQNRFQQTPNGEHQNNVRSLLNINILEEQHNYSYCSLHHENDDYLNPYCALRFERRANSCIF